MKEQVEVIKIREADVHGSSVFVLVPNNAEPYAGPNYEKQVIIHQNPNGPSSAQLIPKIPRDC